MDAVRDAVPIADLFSAYSSGDIDRVVSLIDAGASPFSRNDEGNTLFHLCCTNNTDGPRILERLLTVLASTSVSINSTTQTNSYYDTQWENVDLKLVALYIRNNDGVTPLNLACTNGIPGCVQLFLSHFPTTIKSSTFLELFNDVIKCINNAASWQIIQLLLMKITLRDMMDTCNKHEHTQHLLRLFPMDNEYFQLSDGRTTVLHLAATSGDLEYFTTIVSLGFDINRLDSDGYTPLHRAIEYGCISIANYLISQPNCLCETLTKDNLTPLHDAVGDISRLSLVQGLVERGVDVNISNCIGATALHCSCSWGHLSIIEYLTSLPQINYTKDSWGRKSIHFAAEFGQAHIVKYLVESCNHDINVEDKYGNTPLYMACIYNHLPVVEYLTGQPNCNINSNNERHPLLAATDKEHLEIVKHLIECTDCDINVREKGTGSTPLHKACYNESLSIVEYLISKPQCDIEAIDNNEKQPLHYAACQGHKEIVSILGKKVSEYGLSKCMKSAKQLAEPDTMKLLNNHYEDRRLLINACQSGNVDIVHHLVTDKHCYVNAKWGLFGYTPLHFACKDGHFEIVKFLTNHPQCNKEVKDKNNDRPLHKACESGNLDIIRHLVSNKHCDVNAKGNYGHTPLHYACREGNFEAVKILTNHPLCDIEAKDKINNRPLHEACKSENVGTVLHLLVDKRCDVNAKGMNGYTPLHYACEKSHFEIVKILTDHSQCNIESEDKYNDRPLHKACESGNIDIVRRLKRCDVNAKGRNGYTPLHYACEIGSFEIVKFLTSHSQCSTIEAKSNDNKRPSELAISSLSHFNIISYLSKVISIHQSSGIALLRDVKCILTGPPGAGKSTLKKRLLNQSLDTGSSLSTGVIDAAVQVNSFRKLSQHNAVVTTEWKEQELDEEAILITEKLLPADNTSDQSNRPTAPNENSDESTGTPQPTSVDETVRLTSSFQNNQKSLKGFDLSPIMSQQGNTSVCASSPMSLDASIDSIVIDKSFIIEHESKPNSPAKIVNCEIEESNTEVQNSNLVNDCVKGLSDYVKKIPARKRQEYEKKFQEGNDDNHTMLHIIDTGGQPEFHEILPALITGPAINLLVFKLTEDLRSRYKIIYRTSAGDSKPYETSLSHEEVIFRSLASIACLRQNTIGWSFDKIPIEDNSEPVAFLIATHRDQVDDDKVSEVNQQLRTKIENSSHLFDSDLIQFSQSEQVIFPLDTTKDEEKVDHLRSFLHKVISKKFEELKIPASWCTLSLKLRESKRKLFQI